MNIRTIFGFVLAGIFGTTAFGSVIQGPIVNPSNGHKYYLLSQNTWPVSELEAQALGAHLTTVNDAAENDWIYDTFGGATRNLWIGYTDIAVEGTFVWADGSTSTYTNWEVGQPDDGPGPLEQDCGYIVSEARSTRALLEGNGTILG